ncbi:hypothetical protein ABZ297_27950 [Nonomuraea sp. NPDC005983]
MTFDRLTFVKRSPFTSTKYWEPERELRAMRVSCHARVWRDGEDDS